MSVTFSLWLSDSHEPELVMTSLTHPLLPKERKCIRGKAEGAFGDYGTFQWTSAVRALVVFLLRSRVGAYRLEGGEGSLASSLDYALGRAPAWLIDMFGTDSRGTSLCSRLFTRSNPERKRPGPVGITLGALQNSDIRVFCDERTIDTPEELEALANAIEIGEPGCELGTNRGIFSAPERSPLREMMLREATQALSDLTSFSRRELSDRLEEIGQYRRFRRLAGAGSSELERLAKPALETRLGVDPKSSEPHSALGAAPIKVLVSVAQVGALALFTYLKEVRRLPFEINVKFPHSVRLVEYLLDDHSEQDSDLCVLTLAPAAGLLGRGGDKLRPLMLMPPQSYRVIQPAQSTALRPDRPYDGHFLVIAEEYSSAHFRIDALAEKGLLSKRKSSFAHAENDEVFEAFQEGGASLRTILGFPFYGMLTESGIAKYVGSESNEVAFRDTILFSRKTLPPGITQSLEVVLRNAWLELRENPSLLQQVIELALERTEYSTLARRFSGLYRLEPR